MHGACVCGVLATSQHGKALDFLELSIRDDHSIDAPLAGGDMGPRVSARLNPASLLVSGGMTLPMIGRLLWHTQVQTIQRYAHLFDDPLRAGLDQVDEMLRPKLRLIEVASCNPG
jgi:hypothetical protein